MRLSNFLISTIKYINSEAVLTSHQLMIKSGMIHQVSSGVYCWLPIGVKVLEKIKFIIKKEFNIMNASEIILPSLQPIAMWEKSGRALEASELQSQMFYAISDNSNKYILPPSGEELVANLFNHSIRSYKDVNKILYQVTWKFRNEIRPKHGVMRAKEFLMKDAYSFHENKKEAFRAYEKTLIIYLKIFKKFDLNAIPVLASTGSIGGDYSHEIHVLSNNGESTIYYQENLINYLNKGNFSLIEYENFYAKEKEKHACKNIHSLNILQNRSTEIGHLFYLGQKYNRSLKYTYQDKDGLFKFAEMCCYGIGITRLIAVIIENNNDNHGIVWNESLSPFKFVLINIRSKNSKCVKLSEKIYFNIFHKIDILYNDNPRNSIGKKFADMNLVGISWQIIIGLKHSTDDNIELKNRKTSKIRVFKEKELYKIIKKI